jgi:hypothetical protein
MTIKSKDPIAKSKVLWVLTANRGDTMKPGLKRCQLGERQ